MVDYIAAQAPQQSARKNVSPSTVRTILLIAGGVFFLAAAAHAVRYLLLLVNRSMLLPPFIAIGSLIAGIFVSLAALVAVAAVAIASTSWLVGRRADVFARHGQDDPRPQWMLWAGCLIPPVNLVLAPLFVIELAQAERCRARQNVPVLLWAVAWMIAALICGWATWTSLHAVEAQAVADNTITMVIAYLAGLAVLALLWRVLAGFAGPRSVVARPTHRWVVVAADADAAEAASDDDLSREPADADDVDEESSAIESRDREPAA